MNTAIQHALMIELHNTSMVGGQEAMQEAEIAFSNAMGEMLMDIGVILATRLVRKLHYMPMLWKSAKRWPIRKCPIR